MGSRERPADIGAARAREILARLPAEARALRLAAGLSQDDIAQELGLSRSQLSRIERGRCRDLSFTTAAKVFAALGHALSVKTYPVGDAIQDAAHIGLLDRLHRTCHASLVWQTEVPLPIPGDLRAWDATIRGIGFRAGVEAETRFRDQQALDRKLALKERDGGLDLLILLLLDTRTNRDAVRQHLDWAQRRFPVPGSTALAALAAGTSPGGNALILL